MTFTGFPMDTNWKDHALTANNNVHLGFLDIARSKPLCLNEAGSGHQPLYCGEAP